MTIALVLEMAQAAHPDRAALGELSERLTFARLARLAFGGGALLRMKGATSVVFIGVNGTAWPAVLFAAAAAEIPVTPLNYRLSLDALEALLERLDQPIVVADSRYVEHPRFGR
jgi:acyl-CoA synthetase (AMP-forming)/AMP-acid ligase II